MKLHVENDQSTLFLKLDETEQWDRFSFFPELDKMLNDIKDAYAHAPLPVLFDLASLERIDSSTISLIIQTIRIAGDNRVAVIAPHADIANLLYLMGVDKLADLYESKEQWIEDTQEDA